MTDLSYTRKSSPEARKLYYTTLLITFSLGASINEATRIASNPVAFYKKIRAYERNKRITRSIGKISKERVEGLIINYLESIEYQ